jgi:hypothetical protein
MGVTTFVVKTPMSMVLLIVAACAGVSAFAAFSYVTPKIVAYVAAATDTYDEILPEITIWNGRASIAKPQPYFVHGLLHEKVTVILDTREGKQGEALNYLKLLENGAVITQDALVMKLRGQVRILPLKDVPNAILNSRALRETFNHLVPRLTPWAAAIIVVYFIFVKLLQVLILALVTYAGSRCLSVSISYGQCFRICSFAIVPPVCLDLFQYFTAVNVPGELPAYFALYGIIVILVWRSFYRTQPAS